MPHQGASRIPRFRYEAVGVVADYELRLLGAHLRRIQQVIQSTSDELRAEVARFHERLRRLDQENVEGDFTEERLRQRELADAARYDIDRLLLGTFLMSVWAVWESGVCECIDTLNRRKGSVSVAPGSGDALTRFARSLSDGFGFSLYANEDESIVLRRLVVLRHAYAHAHGMIAHISKRHEASIQQWSRESTSGISIVRGRVVVEVAFAERAHATSQAILRRLLAFTRSGYRSEVH